MAKKSKIETSFEEGFLGTLDEFSEIFNNPFSKSPLFQDMISGVPVKEEFNGDSDFPDYSDEMKARQYMTFKALMPEGEEPNMPSFQESKAAYERLYGELKKNEVE